MHDVGICNLSTCGEWLPTSGCKPRMTFLAKDPVSRLLTATVPSCLYKPESVKWSWWHSKPRSVVDISSATRHLSAPNLFYHIPQSYCITCNRCIFCNCSTVRHYRTLPSIHFYVRNYAIFDTFTDVFLLYHDLSIGVICPHSTIPSTAPHYSQTSRL